MMDKCSNVVYGPKMPLENEQFGNLLFKRIDRQPQENILMVNPESREQLTVGEIQRGSIKLALALSEYVNQGDVIAFLCENDNSTIFPIIASFYLGTTISFINPISHARELKLSFDKIKPKVVFCAKNALRTVLEVKEHEESIELLVVLSNNGDFGGVYTLTEFIDSTKISQNAIDSFKPVNPKSEDDTAIVLCSSGTSGVPKGVMITYKNLVASIPYATDRNFIGLSSSDTILVVVPMFHIFGLLLTTFGIMEGSKLVIVSKFIPNAFLEALANYKVTKITLVPPLAIFLSKNPLIDNYDLSNLKDIFCGAAPISQNVIDILFQRLNVKVRQLYGLTEVGLGAGVPPGAQDKPVVGPNLEVVIRDIDTRSILAANNQGEICLKGPTVTKGYIRDNQATQNAFDEDGYLLTGDVGYIDEDGCLFVVDRIKELIKYKGFQVAPAELEGILLTHPGVKEAAVIGIPNERVGELPTAFVVRQPNSNVSDKELIKYVADLVSVYKQLSGGVIFIKELPKNAAGKIMKRMLRENIVAG